MKAPMNSPDRPTDPTVIVGLPVSFLAQPAKFKSELSTSGNSGSQNRRWEQWKQSAPASTSGPSQACISPGVSAIRAA